MTMYFIFFIITVIVFTFFYRLRIFKGKSPNRNKSKSNIKSWMEMTKEERHAFDLQEKENTFKRKKILLDQIRKEYKDYSKRLK